MYSKAGFFSEQLTQRFFKICLDFSDICSVQGNGTNLIHAAYSVASRLHSLGYQLPAIFFSHLILNSLAVRWRAGTAALTESCHPELPRKRKLMSVVWTSLVIALC